MSRSQGLRPSAGATGRSDRRAWDAVGATTVVVALAIGCARVTGVVPVAVASIAWFVATAWLVGETLRRQLHRWTVWSWVFVLGVGAAALRMCSLGLLRTFGGRSTLYWNVDTRYLVTLARGIGRFGGLDDSLEYAGHPVRYHAGPSWIAGSLHRVAGTPVDTVLLLVVPLVCTVLIAWGGYRLLRLMGASDAAAVVGVVVALHLPRDPFSFANAVLTGRGRTAFLASSSWIFDASLILNSVLGLAVALTAAWVVFDRRPVWALGVGCTAIACLSVLKPQLLPMLVLVLVALHVGRTWSGVRLVPWRSLVIAGAWIVVSAAVLIAANPPAMVVSGVGMDPVGAVRALTQREPFTGPVPILAVASIVVMVAVPRLRRVQPRSLVGSSIGASAAGVVAVMALGGTTLLLSPELARQANTVGFAIGRSWPDFDLGQGLVAVETVLAVIATAQLTVVTQAFGGAVRVVPALVVSLAMLGMAPTTVSALRSPTGLAAYEWTDEAALGRLLDEADTSDGIWLASDLADSAEGFTRSLLAVNITSLSDAQFYLSDVAYGGWALPEVRGRLRAVQRFFGEPWSAGHDRFLRRHRIGYVLVRDRCPPVWAADDFPGRVIDRQGDWSLLEVGASKASDRAPAEAWPTPDDRPAYGAHPCLAFPS